MVVDKLSMALSDIVTANKRKQVKRSNKGKVADAKSLSQQKTRSKLARENKQHQKRAGLNVVIKNTPQAEKSGFKRKLVMPLANSRLNGKSTPSLKDKLKVQITNTAAAQQSRQKATTPSYRTQVGPSHSSAKPRQTPRFQRPSGDHYNANQKGNGGSSRKIVMPGTN